MVLGNIVESGRTGAYNAGPGTGQGAVLAMGGSYSHERASDQGAEPIAGRV